MIERTLVRKIFIAVNNPWICSVNDDPVEVCKDMDYILQEQKLTDRFMLHSDFKVTDGYGLFPVYKIEIHLEAIGTKTAVDLGTVIKASVKDMVMRLDIESYGEYVSLFFQTDCEDLDADKYKTRLNDFKTRNVMTIESNCDI